MSYAAVQARQAEYRQLIEELRKLHPQLLVYDAAPAFCQDDTCQVIDGRQPVFADISGHINRIGGRRVALDFSKKLTAQGAKWAAAWVD